MYSELIKKKRKCSSLSPSIPGRSISAINQELYVLVFKLPVHYFAKLLFVQTIFPFLLSSCKSSNYVHMKFENVIRSHIFP